ncbi:MAG: BtpA/SgcQ family protein [Anaerolineaceae bacterium]|nr:BtpA/SgcQ family protein [Anaerolineaceae bacterium]
MNQINASFMSKPNKPIIGMVHLAGLPGSVHFDQPFSEVSLRAVEDARILVEAGFDAILFQNTGDVPASEEGDEATVAFMTAVGMMIKDVCPIPVGVNVLMNGSKAAFAIAGAINAAFVRIKINTGAVVTSTGIVQGMPHEVLAFRKRINAGNILIFGDVHDRTSAPIGEFPLHIQADLAIRHGGVDALVISGYDVADTQARLKMLREHFPESYLITGGGANTENLAEFIDLSDAIIVGSNVKTGGGFLDPVDPVKAKNLMDAARDMRGG